jgi:hypothetical protein
MQAIAKVHYSIASTCTQWESITGRDNIISGLINERTMSINSQADLLTELLRNTKSLSIYAKGWLGVLNPR